MKKKTIACLALATAMCAGLTACGGKDKETTTAAATEAAVESTTEAATEAPAAAETKTWGDFTIDVPGGYEFKGGDVFDENDTRYFSVKKNSFAYFDFKSEDSEQNMMNQYDYNKKTYTNEQTDVKGSFAGIDWTGFQYSDGFGGYGFELYATSNDHFLRVSSAGFKFDDEVTKSVLESLKVAAGGAKEEAKSENTTEAATEEVTEETTEATTEEKVEFAVTLDMKGATANLPAGYTEIKNAAPTQYVFKSEETGGKYVYSCADGTKEDAMKKQADSLGGDVELQEFTICDRTWLGYSPYDNAYCVATDTNEGYFLIDMDYGTLEDLEAVIKYIEFK